LGCGQQGKYGGRNRLVYRKAQKPYSPIPLNFFFTLKKIHGTQYANIFSCRTCSVAFLFPFWYMFYLRKKKFTFYLSSFSLFTFPLLVPNFVFFLKITSAEIPPFPPEQGFKETVSPVKICLKMK
jgi:hypothetical protein